MSRSQAQYALGLPPRSLLARSGIPGAPPRVSAQTYLLARPPLAAAEGPTRARRLTLLHRDNDPSRIEDLLLDRRYLPREAWRFEDGVLAWEDADNGYAGRLQFTHDMFSGAGSEFVGSQAFSLAAEYPPITYTCDVAVDTGAYVNGTPPALALHWDAASPKWAAAAWQPSVLEFTYQIRQQIIVGQEFYDFTIKFHDRQTGATWAPREGTFGCLISESFVFHMTLSGGYEPASDDRDKQPGKIPSVFPYRIAFQLNPTAVRIDGAMLTMHNAQNGTVVSLRGHTANPSAVGIYRARDGAARFELHDGRMYVEGGDAPVGEVRDNLLTWSGLSEAAMKATGLPADGRAEIDPAGRTLKTDLGVLLERADGMALATARAALAEGQERPAAALNLQTLARMTPYVYRDGWYDGVQHAAMGDFNDILIYFMDPVLRQKYWQTQPVTLPPELQAIAAMAPSGEDPAAWYRSLSVAFLTGFLAQSSDRGADTLNAARADAWLRQTTSASAIFNLQMKALYALEFRKRYPEVTDFLADQKANAKAYAAFIADDVRAWERSVTDTVGDADTVKSVKDLIRNLSTAATAQSLYWAYAFFRYVTSDSQMRILLQLAFGTMGDKTEYARRVQSDIAVLTTLDPSGLFANTYISTTQAQVAASLLPQLADYGNPQTGLSDAVALILEQIETLYHGSADEYLAAMAADARALKNGGRLAELIAAMQQAASRVAGTGDWASVATVMSNAVTPQVGRGCSDLLCTTLASLVIGGTSSGVADWSAIIHHGGGGGLSPSTIVSIAKYATQALYVVVKWGVALNASLGSGPMTFAAFRGLFSTEMLIQANTNLDTGLRRWIVGNRSVEPLSEFFGNLFHDPIVDEKAMATRVFGRNLDEFVGVRLAAVFALAAVIVSAIALANAEGTEEIVQASLALSAATLAFAAAAGEWVVQAFGLSSTLSTFFGVLGALSYVATAAGVIYMIYLWFRSIPTAVEQFASDYALPAGFYMPHGAQVDQFTGYDPDKQPSRLGVAFQIPGGGGKVLTISPKGDFSSGALTYGFDTLLFFNTDGSGKTLIASSAGGAAQVLTADMQSGAVRFAPAIPKDDAKTQVWRVELQAKADWDGDHPKSGKFRIRSLASATPSYLTWSGGRLSLAAAPQDWTISQEPMAVGGLVMADVALLTYSNGAAAAPQLKQAGSTPQIWSASPTLPDFLQINKATGSVSVVPYSPHPLPVMEARFTMQVENGVPGGSLTAPFIVSVRAPS